MDIEQTFDAPFLKLFVLVPYTTRAAYKASGENAIPIIFKSQEVFTSLNILNILIQLPSIS